jgi:poly(3-hydroxybutyrate) depolymerase
MNTYLDYLKVLIIAVLLTACNQNNTENTKQSSNEKDSIVAPIPQNEFEIGSITHGVKCRSNSEFSYDLYLPKQYDLHKKFPVIVCLDPQGNGKKPLDLYKKLADKYGYILLGSNNSKNGNTWEHSEQIVESLLTEVRSKYASNPERIYLMGFSGGARIANAITIKNGAIRGAICCGAAVPAQGGYPLRSNYTLAVIIGNRDFNYVETKKYTMIDLAGYQILNTVITFDGKHEWCPESIMDEAFWWQELNEMKSDLANSKKDSAQERYTLEENKLKLLMEQKEYYQAFLQCKKTINFYNGLANLNYCFEMYKTLKTNQDVDKGLREEETIWSKEESRKQLYTKALSKENMNWWNNQIADLNKKINSSKQKGEANMCARVLEYLSVVMYSQTVGLIAARQLEQAENAARLYLLIDPTNKEANYFWAEMMAAKSKNAEALQALNTAVKLGFDDTDRIKSDVFFKSLSNNPEYVSLIKTMSTQ